MGRAWNTASIVESELSRQCRIRELRNAGTMSHNIEIYHCSSQLYMHVIARYSIYTQTHEERCKDPLFQMLDV